MWWAAYVARMRVKMNVCIQVFWWKNLTERQHLKELEVDRRNIKVELTGIGMGWIGFMWLRIGTSGKIM
jgi:hypothetical protein